MHNAALLNEAELNAIVDELKNIYTEYRVLVSGHSNFKLIGDKYDKDWIKLAYQLVEEDANAVYWIAACFEAYKPFPYVNQLHGALAAGLYNVYRQNNYENTNRALLLQSQTFTTLLNLGTSVVDILNNDQINLSPLFKLILAIHYNDNEKLNDVISKYKAAAKVQYILNPDYAKVLNDLEKNINIKLWPQLKQLLT